MIKKFTLFVLLMTTAVQAAYAGLSSVGFTLSRESHEIAQRAMGRLATGHRIARAGDANPEKAVKAQMKAEEAANHFTQDLLQAQQQLTWIAKYKNANTQLLKIYLMYLTYFRDLASHAQEPTLSPLERSQMNDHYKDLKDKLSNLNIEHRLQTNDFLQELLSNPPQLRHIVPPEK